MADNKQAIREIPKHNIQVKASTEDRSLMKDLGKGVMDEIIIPKSKDTMRNMFSDIIGMFADAMRSSIDRILYPDGNVPNRKPNSSLGVYTGTTNYTSFSRPINNYQPSTQRGRDVIGQRAGNQVKHVWVDSEEKAKMLCGALKEDIDNYGKAKVASLYEMIGERTTFADFKYGWTDPNAISYYYDTNRRGDEYRWFIDLPMPVDITNI